VIVPEKVGTVLYEWYGSDSRILSRFFYKNEENKDRWFVDLYPEKRASFLEN